MSSDPLNYGWTSILTLMNIYEIWQKTQIEHVVLNCDHLIERDGWSGGNNDVKGSMAMSGGLQSGVQHCRCSGYLCCSRRYLANVGIVSVSSKRCPSLQWESRQKAALPSVVESSSSTGRGGRWSSIFISATKTLLKDRSLKTVEP